MWRANVFCNVPDGARIVDSCREKERERGRTVRIKGARRQEDCFKHHWEFGMHPLLF